MSLYNTMENYREFIRWVLSKGSSFNDLTQAGVHLMVEYMNPEVGQEGPSPVSRFGYCFSHCSRAMRVRRRALPRWLTLFFASALISAKVSPAGS